METDEEGEATGGRKVSSLECTCGKADAGRYSGEVQWTGRRR